MLFILERSAMLDTDRVRDERLEFTVDESGRIVGIVAHLGSSPPGDPDPLAPAHDETFELRFRRGSSAGLRTGDVQHAVGLIVQSSRRRALGGVRTLGVAVGAVRG